MQQTANAREELNGEADSRADIRLDIGSVVG
jgi:hypothetical protein